MSTSTSTFLQLAPTSDHHHPTANGTVVLSDPPTQSTAHKVFQVPELLEQILDELDPCDLFEAAAVSHTWKSTFDGSIQLQKRAQLVDDNSLEWDDEWCDFGDKLRLGVNYHLSHFKKSKVHFHLSFSQDADGPLKITPNLRKCFATQPACHQMLVKPLCCDEECEVIKNDTGLTLGDVFDTSKRIYAEHEHCLEMIRFMAGNSEGAGYQSVYPSFRGFVKLPDASPLRAKALAMKAAREDAIVKKVKGLEDAGWNEIWYAYRRARREGKCSTRLQPCEEILTAFTAASSGRNGPRWPEFLAMNKALAPPDYQLNQFEMQAAARERTVTDSLDRGYDSDDSDEHDARSAHSSEDESDNLSEYGSDDLSEDEIFD